LPFQGTGMLPLDVDPKRAWADEHLRDQPIDIMTADRAALLRVPGLSVQAVTKILHAREQHRIRDLGQLRQLGIAAPEQAAPYLLLDGQCPPRQQSLL